MMHADILIIGSGFASYQLIKTLRRTGNNASIAVITKDAGDDYNKPDLSHVFTKQQTAKDLITLGADEFAKQYQVNLFAHQQVVNIDTHAKLIRTEEQQFTYHKLVIATGANTFVPAIEGDAIDELLTFNSLQEYAANGESINSGEKIMIIGAGLIGVELAMDLAKTGKHVTLVEPNAQLMPNLLPEYIALQLQKTLQQNGVEVLTGKFVKSINKAGDSVKLLLNDASEIIVDRAMLCTGLSPNIRLAVQAGLETDRGIVVDEFLQTSAKDVYALGDCAQIFGEVKAFLQPIVLSAASLAKTLAGVQTKVMLPNMMVKVKTPQYPIQLAGKTRSELINRWQFDVDKTGITAKAYDDHDKVIGFVASEEHTKKSFALLRELS